MNQELKVKIKDQDHTGDVLERVYERIVCECGSDKFRVMQGTYYTAIECVECNNKYCVHEG